MNYTCGDQNLGPQGPPGIVWTGPYNPATPYVLTNGVLYNSSAYICIQPNTGIAPTGSPTDPYWSLLAEGGGSGGTSIAQTLRIASLLG
jgi:hypothetical protein